MNKLLLSLLIISSAVSFAHAERKVAVVILPFIINFDCEDKNLSEKARDDFTEKLRKIDYLQIAEKGRYDAVLKKAGNYGMKDYYYKLLDEISQEVGYGVFMYGVISKDKGEVKLAIHIYDPVVSGKFVTPGDNPSKNPAEKDIYEIIKTANTDNVDTIDFLYRQGILVDTTNPKNRKYNLTKEEMLSLLQRYSYDGYAILKEVEKLDKNENIMSYMTFNNNIFSDLVTTVHENCHHYDSLSESSFISSKESIPFPPLSSGDIFSARELIPSIPDELRTMRFDKYIVSDDDPIIRTQNRGYNGLLDEFVAYYQGTKVACDLVEYCKDALYKDDPRIFIDPMGEIYANSLAYYEFKYFIYTDLLYAKDKYPDRYGKMIKNKEFILTFNKIDTLFSKLLERIHIIENDLDAFLKNKGSGFNKDNGKSWIDYKEMPTSSTVRTSSIGNYSDVISLLTLELEKKKYGKLEKEVFKK